MSTNEVIKIKPALLLASLLFTGSALTFHCPADMKKIDDALAAKPALSADKLAEVKKLRAEGEVLHKAGKHQESVDTLAKAMAMLGLNKS
ncbi:hypothetical protein [Aeromonas hydrophila]|uniref:hypothetical protein n=1 Tax=Aeromonas hydrophila TaxID=644 RepID=UPI003D211539